MTSQGDARRNQRSITERNSRESFASIVYEMRHSIVLHESQTLPYEIPTALSVFTHLEMVLEGISRQCLKASSGSGYRKRQNAWVGCNPTPYTTRPSPWILGLFNCPIMLVFDQVFLAAMTANAEWSITIPKWCASCILAKFFGMPG